MHRQPLRENAGMGGECKGRWDGWSFGGAEIFTDEVKVAESNRKGLGWVAEE